MFITGEEDPEEHFGKDTIRLNQDYRDAEVPVTLKIIAGYRHDILHDACAENVFDDIYRSYRQNLREVVNTMTALDQLKNFCYE